MKRVLVCGSRHGVNKRLIWARLVEFQEPVEIIEGGAPGVDTQAREVARAFDYAVRTFPADWKKHGRAAGPLRNQQMLDEGKPDLVLAFHTDPSLGRGTADMVRRARKAGIPVEVIISPPGVP